MKIRLIDPALKDISFEHTGKELKSFWFPHLSLAMVAAITPSDVEVAITDENVDTVDFDEDVDLVGLTAMTMHAPRAYEIAQKFRSRGVPVVMGGIHASTLSEEVKEHVDAVVIGEAENIWGNLIDDFKKGNLKPYYRAESYCSLKNLPVPRLDLLKKKSYMASNCVQTTRGCPFDCSFCSVSQFFGKTYRMRPVEEVVSEVKSLDDGFVIFIDDNIVGNPKYAKELFRALIPLKITWGSQGSLTMVKDKELLELAAKSGCVSMFIGIESLSENNLAMVNKKFNKPKEYAQSIKKIHDYGIMVNGAFIFGFDHDDETIFEKTVEFVEENRIEVATYHILTPLPGTKLFRQLETEGRIFERRWEKYNGSYALYRPRLITEKTLEKGYNWAYQKTYSYKSIAKRVLYPHSRIIPQLGLNIGFRRIAKRIPEGKLSNLSKLIKKLNDSIPIKDIKSLLPTLPHVSREQSSEIFKKAGKHLKIRTVNHERAQTLLIKLEGSLDFRSARKLFKRVKTAVKKSEGKIVIDFSDINFLSLKAINLLLLKNYQKVLKAKDKVKIINLNEKISEMVKNLKIFIADFEMLEDDLNMIENYSGISI